MANEHFARKFEDLEVWKDSRNLITDAYRSFMSVKDYAFKDQYLRALISIMNNIAEGYERRTKKDFAHFLDISKGSAGEARSMVYLAEDLNYLCPVKAKQCRSQLIGISIKLSALSSRLRS